MKRLLWTILLLSSFAYSQTIVFPVSTVQFSQQNAPNNPPSGKAYLYLNSGSGLLACLTPTGGDCLPTSGGGGTPGGASGTLQWNNSASFGGVSQWTTNGTTTLTGSATAVLNLGSLGIAGFTLPSAAGFAPTADGKAGFNTTTHLPVWGSNGTTATLAKTLANAANKWLNSYDQTTGTFTQTQPACTNLSDSGTACAISATAGGDLSGTLPSPTVVKINGVALSGLATGILKNTTGTGVPSIAVAGDFPTLNQNTTGTASNITGVAALVNGGTGTAAASAAAAFDALAPTSNQGDIIVRGVASNARLALGTNGQCLTSNGTTAVWGSCATGSVGAGAGMTTNVIPKATASLTLGDSALSDSGTTLTYAAAGGLFLSTANAPIEFTEGTAPTGSAGHAWLYDDSTAHRLKIKNASNTADTVATFLDKLSVFAATSSAELAGVVSDETGSGLLVFGTSPTLTTPNIGAATATTVNGLTPTALATGFSIAGGTASRTLTVDATVSTSALAPLANPTFTGTVTGTFSGNLTGNASTATTAAAWTTARNLAGNSVNGSANVAFANKFIVQGTTDAGLSAAQFLGALATGIVKNTTTTGVLSIAVAGDFPTLNQNTTGSAATLTTARLLAGNSFNGSADVPFANKFIAQGTADTGLSGAQFLGSLATGLMKNTTTTGVVSIATAADVDSLYTGAGKCYLFKGTSPGSNDGCDTPPGTLSGLGATQVLVATGTTTASSYAGFTSDTSGNVTALSFTSSDTSHAGFIGIGQGPAQAVVANTVGLTGGTAITGYNIVFPSAASSGFLKFTNVANVVTGVFDAAINLSSCTDCTGVLPPANGGTGANTLTNHAPLLGAGTSAVNPMAVGGLGTTIIGQGASADPIWSATLTLGVAGTTSGSFVLANGGVGGANITLQNNIVTSSYNWNFPSSAGTAGQCLTSGGGGASAMTWGSCGGGTPAWDTITAPTTSNLALSMATHTTAFTYGDQGASASTALFTITDSASTASDLSQNAVFDTGGSSKHVSMVARFRGSDIIKVCPSVDVATGIGVIGAVIPCATINSVNATPIAKFLVESATNAHVTARLYQNGAAQTGTSLEIFTKTVSGTGFNLIDAKVGCTDGDTTCAAGTSKFTLRGDGLLTVASSVSATTFTSTISTGTAPFTVSSTTNVANLNASSLNGATFAAPGAIGGGTPGSGAFTTITGTSSATLGTNGGTGGSVVLNGSTSGSATISASATGVLALPSGTTATSMVLTTPNIGAATGTTLSLGTDNSVAGTLTLANGSANAHTIWGSGATTTNTINGFAAVPTTGHLIDCTVTTTVCLLHDSGVVTADVLTYHTPATGIARTTSGSQAVASSELSGDVTTSGSNVTTIKTSVSLTTPVIGAATGTSLYATGIIDGKATVNVSTTTPCTLGTASANCSAVSSLSGYTINEHATAATAIVYNLPTAAAGLQYCVANGFNGSAANTGTLELLTSATGQFIIYTDGTLTATHGNVTSTGAAGDAACVVGVDATHWLLYVNRGAWTKN